MGDEDIYLTCLKDGVLPVELTSFSANVNGSSVSLKWETATEVNNYGFDIERYASSLNGNLGNIIPSGDEGWEKIGFIEGFGNSNSTKYYEFTDNIAVSGKYFYRLKQVDIDGTYEYSDFIEAGTIMSQKFSFTLSQNYPNPFNPTTIIDYTIPNNVLEFDSNVKLKVYDILGRELMTLVNEKQESGSYSINFDASDLSNGIYVYILKAGNFIKSNKMILLK